MSWRDNLQLKGRGSFRGVEFFVNSAESTVGRRTVVHEYPGRDTPRVEDLGRAARRFTLVAYVLGDDYIAQRDALRKEFEKDGSGPLVHPFWGNLTVTITGPIRIKEDFNEGRMARFSVTVVQSDDADLQPSITPDTTKEVKDSVTEAKAQVIEQFVGDEVSEVSRVDQFKRGDIPDDDAWTITDVIEDVRDKATALAGDVTTALNTANGYVNAAINVVDDVGNLITDFSDAVEELILLPETLAGRIQTLGAEIMDKINTFEGIWNDYIEQGERLYAEAATPGTYPSSTTPDTGARLHEILRFVFEELDTFGDDLQEITGTTPMELIAAGNQAAMISFFKSSMLLEVCQVVIEMPFASYDEATEMRDYLAGKLDTLADASGDLAYRALTDLRSAISRHLTSAASELPRIISYTPPRSTPALALAHKLYGDSRYDIDIITRNNLRNPLKVSGGVELEVLASE